ncbi:TetR/AcrR family transcriptional regulator [Gordonia sp. VNQ95]|uniref:TetR/AcrR family transcriptional regulator n=1 Tax=Gordonia TaxID=2053 RepID=UPI0032B3B4A5
MSETPTTPVPTTPAPRTQAQRSAATRDKVLDATVALLIERGYGATTTQEVNRRAGVSRGALLHQFPTRESLVVAAIGYLVDRRKAEIIERAGAAEPDLELLLDVFDGPLFYAALELWVASRTDPALREALIPVEQRIADELLTTGLELFGHRYSAEQIEVAAELARGLAISRLLRDPSTDRDVAGRIFTTFTEALRR